MESSSPRPPAEKPRIALVQGESFSCVAVEAAPGRWIKVQDGTELPPVLEILKEMGHRNSSLPGQ
jgi:hypothetical protein